MRFNSILLVIYIDHSVNNSTVINRAKQMHYSTSFNQTARHYQFVVQIANCCSELKFCVDFLIFYKTSNARTVRGTGNSQSE